MIMRFGRADYFLDMEGNNSVQRRKEGMVDAGIGGQWVATRQAMHRCGTIAHIHGVMMHLHGMRIRSQRHPQHQDDS